MMTGYGLIVIAFIGLVLLLVAINSKTWDDDE
jgi:nitrogen fixation-related uncharacterized protein